MNTDAEAELRLLRAEIAAMRDGHERQLLAVQKHMSYQDRLLRRSANGAANHLWLKHVVKGLETDPHVQYKVHLYGVIYWLINFPLVAALFFGFPSQWLKWGVFITLVYSIYANFATDYGGMSAAMAAFGQYPLPELPVEQHVDAPGVPDA